MIYCILGQTASGKTSLALSLARKFSLPIISADAYQCYKVMQVGTDKPTRKEVKGLSYYFYDEYEPDQEMSVFLFQKECRPILEDYLSKGKDVIVVGGNFLYVKALLYNYVFQEEKQNSRQKYENMSLEEMRKLLLERSKETFDSIDNQNPRRVIRALAQLDEGKTRKDILLKNDGNPLYPTTFYQLEIDKEEGNKKIDERIDLMIQQGLVEECKHILEQYGENNRILSTIGYQEMVEVLKQGKEVDKKVFDLIKIHTHQYAKKQRTFLRHQFPNIIKGSKEKIEHFISEQLKKTGNVN